MLAMKIQPMEISTQEQKAYINTLYSNTTLYQAYETVIEKHVDGKITRVTSATTPIPITIAIPSELIGQKPYLIVCQNGVMKPLYDIDNDEKTITYIASEFTSYAFAYQKAKPVTPPSNSETTSSAPVSSKTETTSDSTTPSKPSSNIGSDTSSSISSEESSNIVSSSENKASSDKEKSTPSTSNTETPKMKQEIPNLPVKLEHNTRFLLVASLINIVILLAGIFVVMIIRKSN